MDIQTLAMANQIKDRIEAVEKEIRHLNYILSNNTLITDAEIQFKSSLPCTIIPSELVHTIAKLVLAEYTIELDRANKQFNNL